MNQRKLLITFLCVLIFNSICIICTKENKTFIKASNSMQRQNQVRLGDVYTKFNRPAPHFNKNLQTYKSIVLDKIVKRKTTFTPTNSNNLRTRGYAFLQREIVKQDETEAFLGGIIEKDLKKLPLSANADIKPWSGTYWPSRNGGLSVRYPFNKYNTQGELDMQKGGYKKQYTYTESVTMYKQPDEFNTFSTNSQTLQSHINDDYSVAEKYDLLVGDTDFTLTNMSKNDGKKWKDDNGDTEGWIGICHGWSPAAYWTKRPLKPVTLTAADGKTKLTFLPDDLKGLASLWYAQADYSTNFIGNICNKKPEDIKVDADTGLYNDYECFSINPGAFVITMANQIGLRKKNLLFDPSADAEIWNQPVYGYKMQFFNLLKNDVKDAILMNDPASTKNKLDDIKTKLQQTQNVYIPPICLNLTGRDATTTSLLSRLCTNLNVSPNSVVYNKKFLNFLVSKAAAKTKYVVGVYFKIEYTVETPLNHADKPHDDQTKTEDYTMALELDENDQILGGEWMTNSHANFVWKIDESKPISGLEDNDVKTFDGSVDSLRKITSFAKKTSKKLSVIKAIVDYLLAKSID